MGFPMMEEASFIKPTVKDMIDYLQTCDPEKPFRIRDTDTGWTICIVHIDHEPNGLFLHGEYWEMED